MTRWGVRWDPSCKLLGWIRAVTIMIMTAIRDAYTGTLFSSLLCHCCCCCVYIYNHIYRYRRSLCYSCIYIYIYTFLSFLSLLFPTPAVVTFFSSLLRWVFLLCCSRGSSTPILYGERDRKRWLRFVRADVIRWRQRRSTVRKCVLRYTAAASSSTLRFGAQSISFTFHSLFSRLLIKTRCDGFFSLSLALILGFVKDSRALSWRFQVIAPLWTERNTFGS